MSCVTVAEDDDFVLMVVVILSLARRDDLLHFAQVFTRCVVGPSSLGDKSRSDDGDWDEAVSEGRRHAVRERGQEVNLVRQRNVSLRMCEVLRL